MTAPAPLPAVVTREAAARPATVLFVDPVGEVGGAERVLLDLVAGLDRSRFRPVVACLRPGPLVEEAQRRGAEAVGFPAHRLRQPHRVAHAVHRLRRLVAETEAEIVHANAGHLLVYAAGAARQRGARVVWHVHDPLTGRGAFERAFRWIQRPLRPDWTIFANPGAAESYRPAFPRLGESSVVLPGVDTRLPAGDADRARARWNIPASAPVVTMFARLQRHKGHLHAVEVAHRLRGVTPDARFVLCGGTLFGQDTGYGEAVQARIAQLDLEDRVLLPGFVTEEEKLDLLAASAAVLHPADVEPFGVTVLEAMAAGRPVVATDAAGPSLLVGDGETGRLVPRGDLDALARAVSQVLGDPDLASSWGRAGRQRARGFSVASSVAAVEAIYRQLLEARA